MQVCLVGTCVKQLGFHCLISVYKGASHKNIYEATEMFYLTRKYAELHVIRFSVTSDPFCLVHIYSS